MNYVLHLLIYFEIYAILALSLNLVVGYCGLLTLAHAGYFAVGGYTYALLSLTGHWGFLPAAIMAMAVPAVLSLAVSLPAWRFRGDFFVLMSLAVQAFIFSLLYNWTASGEPVGSLRNLTNGPFGLTGISSPMIFGWHANAIGEVALWGGCLLAGCMAVFWLLMNSPWGRLLKCMRDDELAARGLGKNTRLAKMQAMAFACSFAGLSGALYASYVGYLDPTSARLDESILMFCMVIVGGVGNFRGPLVGAMVLLLIPEALRFMHLPDAAAASLRLMAYGMLLIVMMHTRPQGLAGEYRIQ